MSNLLHPCLIVGKQEMRNDVLEEIITKGQAKDENLIQFMQKPCRIYDIKDSLEGLLVLDMKRFLENMLYINHTTYTKI